MNLEYLIDEIERIQSEATVNVIESMIDYNDKMEVIQECVNDNPDMFSEYFQEGAIDNVKMKGKSDSNKLVTAIKFIPRLIMELIKQVKLKLKRHPENLSKDEVEHVHKICERCLNDKSVFDKVKDALGEKGLKIAKVAGASIGVAGTVLAISEIKKRKKEKDFEKFFTVHEKFPIGDHSYILTENGKATIHIMDLEKLLEFTKDLMKMTTTDEFKNAIKSDPDPAAVESINSKFDSFKNETIPKAEYDFVKGYRLCVDILKECSKLDKNTLTTSENTAGAKIVERFYGYFNWIVEVAGRTLVAGEVLLKSNKMVARNVQASIKKDKNWRKNIEGITTPSTGTETSSTEPESTREDDE